MTCENDDLNLLSKEAFEKALRFHTWIVADAVGDVKMDDMAAEAKMRKEFHRMREMQKLYTERFGADAYKDFFKRTGLAENQ